MIGTQLDAVALTALGLMLTVTPVHAQSAAELAAMKAEYRRPAARPVENRALADLGRLLFWDPRVSASGNTACASCHLPDRGWSVAEAKSRNNSGKLTSRKSQPLVGLGHVQSGMPFGWDGRNPTLEAQVKNSVATGAMSARETGNPVKVEVVEQRIRDVPEYVERFKAVLPGAAITMDTIAQAIAAFERTMEPGPAPFDRWIEGDEGAISGYGEARLRAVQPQDHLLCLPHRLALHRRQVSRHRRLPERSRARYRAEGRRGGAIRLQDADFAFGRAARALYA